MSDQVAPVQAAPAKAAGTSARPCKDGDAPPNAFAALLGVARSATSPPADAAATARTAHAEGSKAEGDSSGHTDTATTPAAGQALPPLVSLTVAVPVHTQAPPAGGGHAANAIPVTPAGLPQATPARPRAAQPRAEQTGVQPAAPRSAADGGRRPASVPAAAVAAAAGQRTVAAGEHQHTGSGGAAKGRDNGTGAAETAAGSKRGGHRVPPAPGHQPAQDSPIAATHEPARDPRPLHRRGSLHRLSTHLRSDPAPATRAPQPSATTGPARGQQPDAASAARVAAALPRVRVHELAESMQAMVKVASRRGSAAARITLRPAQLGGVQVRLRAHQGGISASLTAQTSAGAQALGASHAELRRSLESQGILVHSIEVQLAGDGLGADAHARGWQSQTAATALLPEDDDTDSDQTIEPSTLPDAGGQVDVLA